MTMPPRRTIGESPLDAVVPPSAERLERSGGTALRREGVGERAPKVTKERMTVHLPVDLIDRVKNAVYWTPGLTLAGLAERALLTAVDAMEAERGEAFAPRREELKGGRPLK